MGKSLCSIEATLRGTCLIDSITQVSPHFYGLSGLELPLLPQRRYRCLWLCLQNSSLLGIAWETSFESALRRN